MVPSERCPSSFGSRDIKRKWLHLDSESQRKEEEEEEEEKEKERGGVPMNHFSLSDSAKKYCKYIYI